MCHKPLPFAVGREELPPEARWSCRQARAKRPAIGNRAKMNLTNYDSN
jgi:hypothetical protein